MAAQNSIFEWVRDHRVHRKYSETDADPHNAKRGLFFSHVGWLLMKKHPDVIKKGQLSDLTDLYSDKIVMFQERYGQSKLEEVDSPLWKRKEICSQNLDHWNIKRSRKSKSDLNKMPRLFFIPDTTSS